MAHKTEHNSYVMTRPQQPGESLSVEKAISFKEKQELEELYQKSFLAYLFNTKGLSKKQHQRCVNAIFPTIALVLFHEQPELTEKIRTIFVQNAKKKSLETFESFPDQESGFCFILTEYLQEFLSFVDQNGAEQAEASYKLFVEAIKLVYFELPVAHIFNLIEVAEQF